MDIKEIQNLIRFVAKSGASEVSLEMEDVKINNQDRTGENRNDYCSVSNPKSSCGCSSTANRSSASC